MTSARKLFSAVCLAALLVGGTAAAQTPLPVPDPLDARDAKRVERMEKVVRELRAIVFQLRDSGKPVVVQPADTDARMEEMSTRIRDLEETLRRLNGSLETTQNDLSKAQRENSDLKAQVTGLTERLGAAEQKIVTPPPPEPPTEAATAPTGDPTEAFAKARQLMLGGDYDGAELAFADYVAAYPEAPKTPEARYWWGKTLTVRGAHADAAKAYIGAVRGWPQTGWAPDAVLELGRSLAALKRTTEACQALAELPKRYPKAPANVTARAATARTQAKCAA
jgi:tol-pal system protein YbgF